MLNATQRMCLKSELITYQVSNQLKEVSDILGGFLVILETSLNIRDQTILYIHVLIIHIIIINLLHRCSAKVILFFALKSILI